MHIAARSPGANKERGPRSRIHDVTAPRFLRHGAREAKSVIRKVTRQTEFYVIEDCGAVEGERVVVEVCPVFSLRVFQNKR